MEAYVQLALMEKARRVFSEDDGVFVSFPLLRNASYPMDRLAGILSPATGADYAAAADFARTVNVIPRDIVADADDDRYLWEAYADALKSGVAGSAAEGGEADPRLAAAQALLRGPSGRGESEAYRLYRQLRDAWIAAREDYGARRLTGELSTDPDERRAWAEREPVLRAAVEGALSDWETIGRRGEIEKAVAAERAAAAADPARRWLAWQSALDPDVDFLNDAGGRYAPTGYAPIDLDSDDNWSSFELKRGEMEALIAGAPQRIREALADGGGGDVESVSFRYRSVGLVRPWFDGAALTSRIWRLPAGDDPLSDGAEPPSGSCPAYVSALVLMRGLSVRRSGGGRPQGAGDPPSGPPGRVFTLDPALLTKRLVVGRAVAPVPQVEPPPDAPLVRPQAFSRLDAAAFKARPLSLRASGLAVRPPLREAVVLERAGLSAHQIHSERMRPRAVRFRQLAAEVSHQPRFAVAAVDPAPPPAAPEPAPPPADDGRVTILAFVCKRLPRTPDPLPDLIWS
jgi:hypothetical protein